MAHDRRTSYGVILCVVGVAALAFLTTVGSAASATGRARAQVQETPSEEPSESQSPPASAEPSPTPRPSRSPTPRPTCSTVVCPTLTPRPSPSRSATATALPLPSEEPSESPTPRRRTPDPLATHEDPESTAPEPVLPTIKVSEVPVAPPSFDAEATEEPEPVPSSEAAGDVGGGPSPARLAAFALVAALLLGGAGATGLYLTREPKETP